MSQPIRGQGSHLVFPISPKNTNLVEGVEILLPVKFCWIPFSGFREEIENVSANQRPERSSCFSDRPEKHKLGRGRWDFASCQVSFEFRSAVSEEKSKMWKFTPDGRTDDRLRTDGRTTDGALWQQLTRAFGSSELKSCLALCHKLIYEIAIFHSINYVIKILITFFCLWNEISLFHKLNYDTVRTRKDLGRLYVPKCPA